MFETEAGFAETKMLIKCNGDYSKKQDYKKGWQDGAEFGFNKANEWHYVKDEGYPKDKEYVLIYTDLNNCYVATKVENHFMSKGCGFIPMSTVTAWKEIVLPEIKESE